MDYVPIYVSFVFAAIFFFCWMMSERSNAELAARAEDEEFLKNEATAKIDRYSMSLKDANKRLVDERTEREKTIADAAEIAKKANLLCDTIDANNKEIASLKTQLDVACDASQHNFKECERLSAELKKKEWSCRKRPKPCGLALKVKKSSKKRTLTS